MSCNVKESWKCDLGGCINPGDGSGIYSNLEECTSNCHLNYIDEFNNNHNNKKNIFKIFNLLGQEYKLEPTGVFIIIYENGLAEKKIIFDKQ